MTFKDKPKRGGGKPFDRDRKQTARPTSNSAPQKKKFAPKAGGDAAVSGDAPVKPERISKIMARAGVASRRDIERMIMEGRVSLNGVLLETPVVNATLADRIEVDGVPIRGIERTRLWLYHKPAGLVTTNSDPEGRPTVFENLPEGLPRVLSVGRLDINTEGLLLLTNDGGLSRVLELPTTGWLRRYRVRAHGEVDQAALDKLKEGIAVDGVLYGSIDATLDRVQGRNVWITMGLREGKNREIKNVLGALGLEVNRLIRISYGPFQLGDLPEGQAIEVRGRMLRDQLGPRLIEDAKANFDAPIYDASAARQEDDEEQSAARPGQKAKPERAGGRTEDRRERSLERLDTRRDDRKQGDRKFGERKPAGRFGGDRDARDTEEDRSKRRPQTGTSRTANVWMAPGARPVAGGKATKPAASAAPARAPSRDADKSEHRVVVKRAEEDSDWIRADEPARKPRDGEGGFSGKRSFGDKPARGRGGFEDRPPRERSFGDAKRGDRKPRGDDERPRGKPFSADARSERPRGEKPFRDKPFGDKPRGDGPRSDGPRGDRPFGDKPRGGKPGGKPFGAKAGGGKFEGGKPSGGRPSGGKPAGGKPGFGKPHGERADGGKPSGRPGGPKGSGGRGGKGMTRGADRRR